MQLTYIDDFLGQPDFPRNLMAPLAPLADRIRLAVAPDEVGVVCPNILTASNYLVDRYGAGPFFLGAGSPKDFTENGQVKPYTTRVGFGYYRGVLIELAEGGIGSDLFGRALSADGRITLHHLGFWARGDQLSRKDVDGKQASFTRRLADAGYRPAVTTRLEALGLFGNVTVFGTGAETGGIETEFLDIRLFGRRGIKFGLPEWLLRIAAKFQIITGHRFIQLPAEHQLPPAS